MFFVDFFALIGFGTFFYCCFYGVATIFLDCDVFLWFCEKFGKSPRRLKGKVVFITGASSGIGEHTAYALAKHGVKLVLTARRNHELQRVKNQCIAVSNGLLEDKDVLVIPMDVTDLASHKMHFQHAVRHFGTVDVLVNNAGRSQRALWDDIEISVDKQMFELNVFSVVNLSRVALEHFNKRGCGQIAIVSSLAGVTGVPFSATYTGTKHAINGYFEALRFEKMNKNIHVTLLCPGPVFTNFLQESFTGKDGQKYGIPANPTDKRLTAARCGELNAIAITNKISEAWMTQFPVLPFTYIAVYFPIIHRMALKILGTDIFFKLRDSKNRDLQEVRAV